MSNSKDAFEFQLDILMEELHQINQSIDRMDQITQTTKNWAITVWSGSIVLLLIKSQYDLKKFIIFTAIIPILFWFIDAWWRHLQRTMIFRIQKISEFLNGPDYIESFKQRKLVNFIVLDPRGKQYKGLKDYKRYSSIWRTLRFKQVFYFYLGLVLFSIIIGLFLIYSNLPVLNP